MSGTKKLDAGKPDAARPKDFPTHANDSDAERFVAEADLTEYDFSGFQPMRFELEAKSASINMRVPESLLRAVKETARAQGIPYQRYIRLAIERALAKGR
ncbi:BrnA antitoxin family protein [Methylobacterium oxalidis]|uniref:Uncharacterized protein n=1 Tax=Methylobacterium oxalidis TaxID=944322 RepID=A0A512JA16_9HYPH|nr:BrnA antitoxin family protein [Methylobacterium oxalidis]GEP06729.1 hypothetical protein MOX02_47670 [Methylobacterium oxalidis]GJE33616.1 hypothetical protein LDDCCGHA_3817 [Methylobacterium oxalidis]GLS64730.1 hypothetical protein GCM10007888_31110 [Methylobacterium oxalidis]